MSASADATGEPADLVTPDARLSARLREYRPDHADGMVIWLDLRGLSDEACATTIDIVREGLSDALGSAVKGWVLSRNGLALFPPNGRPLPAGAHPAEAWRALECSAPRPVRPSDLRSGLSAALRLANQISEPAARKRVLYIGAAALPVPGGAALVDSMNYQRLPVDVVAITTKILSESAALLREWSASSGGTCIGCGQP